MTLFHSQISGEECIAHLQLPRPGIYAVKLFAAKQDKHEGVMQNICNYIIKVRSFADAPIVIIDEIPVNEIFPQCHFINTAYIDLHFVYIYFIMIRITHITVRTLVICKKHTFCCSNCYTLVKYKGESPYLPAFLTKCLHILGEEQ